MRLAQRKCGVNKGDFGVKILTRKGKFAPTFFIPNSCEGGDLAAGTCCCGDGDDWNSLQRRTAIASFYIALYPAEIASRSSKDFGRVNY